MRIRLTPAGLAKEEAKLHRTRPCWYCGEKRKVEREHVFPRSLVPLCRSGLPSGQLGPLHIANNTVDACVPCNRDKGNLTLEQYRVLRLGSTTALFAGETRTIGRPGINKGSDFDTVEETHWVAAIAAAQEFLCLV